MALGQPWLLLELPFFGGGCHTMWYMGSQFSEQGSNPCPLQWRHSLNHWATREVPQLLFFLKLPYVLFPRWLSGKESTCQCRRCRFDPWVGKIPQRRKWQPTPVLLPEKLYEQKSLAGSWGPWGLSMYLSISHIYPTYLSITYLSAYYLSISHISSYLLSIYLFYWFCFSGELTNTAGMPQNQRGASPTPILK